jgi:hypothetical protein
MKNSKTDGRGGEEGDGEEERNCVNEFPPNLPAHKKEEKNKKKNCYRGNSSPRPNTTERS